jgi:hypothetical protein
LPDIATIDDVIRLSAIYINEFNRENDRGERELIDNPEAVY